MRFRSLHDLSVRLAGKEVCLCGFRGSADPTEEVDFVEQIGWLVTNGALIVDGGDFVARNQLRRFLGDFKKAFAYMENWPITVTQSPLGSEADFNQDILIRFKASERGAAAVPEPSSLVLLALGMLAVIRRRR